MKELIPVVAFVLTLASFVVFSWSTGSRQQVADMPPPPEQGTPGHRL